jgi:hypothetical protein
VRDHLNQSPEIEDAVLITTRVARIEVQSDQLMIELTDAKGGRPKIDRHLRDLMRKMSKENPLWGAPRIHGELLKLGFAEWTVSKYMVKRHGAPSQGWWTFLRNHAEGIAAIDLCVVPTVTFERLFAFLIVGHCRRQFLWFAVT